MQSQSQHPNHEQEIIQKSELTQVSNLNKALNDHSSSRIISSYHEE